MNLLLCRVKKKFILRKKERGNQMKVFKWNKILVISISNVTYNIATTASMAMWFFQELLN